MINIEKNILKYLYNTVSFRFKKIIEFYILRREKGEFWSSTLREIYRETYGIEVGIGSYGCFKPGNFPNGTKIGNYTSIAGDVKYLNGDHPKNFVSTHPMFYNSKLGFVKEDKITRNNINIGNDVWIGYGTIIVSGCKSIGHGSIIAAGSVVTKNIKPYSIVAGVPAKVIGQRFNEEVINEIEKSKWFNKNPNELANYVKYFEDPQEFIKRFGDSYEKE